MVRMASFAARREVRALLARAYSKPAAETLRVVGLGEGTEESGKGSIWNAEKFHSTER